MISRRRKETLRHSPFISTIKPTIMDSELSTEIGPLAEVLVERENLGRYSRAEDKISLLSYDVEEFQTRPLNQTISLIMEK